MKNVILALAFMLIGTFAFANEGIKSADFDIETTTTVDGLTTTFVFPVVEELIACPIYHYVYRDDGSLMGQFTVYAPDGHEDCYGVVFHL